MRRKRKKAGRKEGLSPYEKWMSNEENKSKGVVTPHFVAKDHKPVNPNASKLKDLHDTHGTNTFQKTLAEKVMAPKGAADHTAAGAATSPEQQDQQPEPEADEYAMYGQQDDKIAGTWADEQPQYGQEENPAYGAQSGMDESAYGAESAPSYEGEQDHEHDLDAESTHNPVFQQAQEESSSSWAAAAEEKSPPPPPPPPPPVNFGGMSNFAKAPAAFNPLGSKKLKGKK
jgi:hypothetical protein